MANKATHQLKAPTPIHTVEVSTNAKLPPISTIPHFNSSADWGLWINPMMALIDHLGLYEHICPIPPPSDPTCKVALPPPYPPHWTPEEAHAYKNFWKNNNVCSYIISSKLSAEIFNSLPPAQGGPYRFPVQTARHLLEFLQKCYSVGSAASAQKIKDAAFSYPEVCRSWDNNPNGTFNFYLLVDMILETNLDF
ncbi:hypothetical protein C0993_009422 [Termitomyces sp. T159_Od127]|nr:hypothetical protein C0993_009422 [Termitomyces sp. T159_Od127]